MCKFYSKFNRTKFTVIRHSNIYGPYDKYDLEKSHVFGATITKVMNAVDNKITVWGQGLEKRDLLYINDLISFIEAAIEKQESNFEIFNVGLGEFIRIMDLVDKIIFHCKINLEVVHDLSKPSIPTSISLDCSKAKKLLENFSSVESSEHYKTKSPTRKLNSKRAI
jgi:nucleoside-diphosphate-sugar epimerase